MESEQVMVSIFILLGRWQVASGYGKYLLAAPSIILRIFPATNLMLCCPRARRAASLHDLGLRVVGIQASSNMPSKTLAIIRYQEGKGKIEVWVQAGSHLFSSSLHNRGVLLWDRLPIRARILYIFRISLQNSRIFI